MMWQVVGLIVACVFVQILASLRKWRSQQRALKKLPSPPGAHWLYGHSKQGPFDPGYKWLIDTVASFPRLYTLWQGNTALPVLVHPETIKPLLTGAVGDIKSAFYDLFVDWLGHGLGIARGAKWLRNRRLLNGSFHLDVLRAYTPVSNDCVEVLLAKMDKLAAEGKPLRVNRELVLCTFDVILRTACSYKSNCQVS